MTEAVRPESLYVQYIERMLPPRIGTRPGAPEIGIASHQRTHPAVQSWRRTVTIGSRPKDTRLFTERQFHTISRTRPMELMSSTRSDAKFGSSYFNLGGRARALGSARKESVISLQTNNRNDLGPGK